jgi:hypothetical protein
MVMVKRRDDIVILYTQGQQVRHVRMNARHPAQLKPTPSGDSIGHYEGDTLVIDTAAIASPIRGGQPARRKRSRCMWWSATPDRREASAAALDRT